MKRLLLIVAVLFGMALAAGAARNRWAPPRESPAGVHAVLYALLFWTVRTAGI